MADFPLVTTGGGNRAASTTYYSQIGTTQAHSLKTTEDAAANREWKNAGTFSKLAVVLSANTRGSSTVTFRVNGADGNQTVAISASGTGQFQDTSNSDTIAANDAVCLKEVTGSGGSSHTWQSQAVVFSGSAPRLYANQFNAITGTVTYYNPVSGRFNLVTGEGNAAQVAPRAAGTLRYLAVHPDAFSGTSAVYVTRINGADGNMTITATSTAFVEDTTNSDVVSATDLINYKGTFTSVTGYLGGPQCEWLPSTTGYPAIHGTEAGAFTINNAIQYWPMVSSANRFTTENSIQTTYDAAVTLSYLYLYVGSASLTGSSTITSRINGADGNMTLTGINATGTYEDTTHSDTIAAADRVGLKSTALTSGSARTDLFRVVVTVPSTAHVSRWMLLGLG